MNEFITQQIAKETIYKQTSHGNGYEENLANGLQSLYYPY